MSKFIALKSGSHEILPDAWNSDFSHFKQQILLFDQIGIFKLSQLYKSLENSMGFANKLNPNLPQKIETIILELEWLRQTGVIFELTMQEEINNVSLQQLGQEVNTARELLNRALEIVMSDLKHVADETHKMELMREQHFTILRLMSIIMEKVKGVTAVTTLPHIEYNRDLPNSNKSNVVQIVINKLPLPNNETPWKQIIDYRNDIDTQKYLMSLRRWISNTSKQNLSSIEIEQEIEALINDFQEHMKLHKLKANTETVEVIVNSSADIIGNLLTLKFSKVINPLFAIKKRQLSLLEAESNAPGREMAYIIKTKDTF